MGAMTEREGRHPRTSFAAEIPFNTVETNCAIASFFVFLLRQISGSTSSLAVLNIELAF